MSGPTTPSLLGPWTDKDDLRLQRRSHALLGELLQRDDLPVVPWRVSTWSLTATVTDTNGGRPVVEAWAAALGLEIKTHKHADHDRVIAVGKVKDPHGHPVEVGIWTDVYHPLDVDEPPNLRGQLPPRVITECAGYCVGICTCAVSYTAEAYQARLELAKTTTTGTAGGPNEAALA